MVKLGGFDPFKTLAADRAWDSGSDHAAKKVQRHRAKRIGIAGSFDQRPYLNNEIKLLFDFPV